MSFKSIFFTLFIPFGLIVGSDLSKTSVKKINELEDINKIISEKEELLNNLMKNAKIAYQEIYNVLKTDDAEKFGEEISKFQHAVSTLELTKENITKLLSQELFYANLNSNKDLVKRLKFILIRRKIEYSLLSKLLDSYSTLAMQLLD